ncbi:MAG: ATP-binding protein [Chloroflexota bacterium]
MTHIEYNTTLINHRTNVVAELQALRRQIAEWKELDKQLKQRAHQIDPHDRHFAQKAGQIAEMRKRIRFMIVDAPLEIDGDALIEQGYEKIQAHLGQQFAGLTKEDRKLWLKYLMFIMTPDLRRLKDKIEKIRAWSMNLGQQRNLLLGGESGMGKSTLGNWYSYKNLQSVEREYNLVPIVKVDAPTNNNTPKPLLQRIVAECGYTYTKSDTEEDLLAKIQLYFQTCGVEVLIIDEIEHIHRDKLKRSVLEISNIAGGIPIICASCHPENFIGSDVEIKGRWNDSFTLTPYTDKKLQQLLAHIELVLPFSQPSNLSIYEFEERKGKKTKTLDGPAKFIERKTNGILRDIMILIIDACEQAIDAGEPNLSMSRLETAWNNIQTGPPGAGKAG